MSSDIDGASLVTIANRTELEKKECDSELRELVAWKAEQPRVIKRISNLLSPLPTSDQKGLQEAKMKLALAGRRIEKESQKQLKLNAKTTYIDHTLPGTIHKYAELVHPTLLDDVSATLPRELRDMAYEHLFPTDTALFVYPDPHGKEIRMCNKDATMIDLPYPTIPTSHVLFDEIIEAFYRNTTFIINAPAFSLGLLDRFLTQQRWTLTPNLVPKAFIKRISVVIRLSRPADSTDVMEKLEKLHSLRKHNATISLWFQVTYPQLLADFLELSRPLLDELRGKGHCVCIIDKWT